MMNGKPAPFKLEGPDHTNRYAAWRNHFSQITHIHPYHFRIIFFQGDRDRRRHSERKFQKWLTECCQYEFTYLPQFNWIDSSGVLRKSTIWKVFFKSKSDAAHFKLCFHNELIAMLPKPY